MIARAALTAAIVAIAPITQTSGPLLATAFTPSHTSSAAKLQSSSSWALSAAAGKGFGDKPAAAPTKQKISPLPSESAVEETTTPSTTSTKADDLAGGGSKLLQQLRSREAEKRDEELRKLRELRETDALLAEDAGAAAIPERVAQRMGKRMLPFVGIPLFGSFASFIGFWYLAVYKVNDY